MRLQFINGKEWFFEDNTVLGEPAAPMLGLLPLKDIYSANTPFQEIEIFDTEEFGRVMTLDGIIQLSTEFEYVYHEMLTHIPAFQHPNPESVLIIGGGDGGTLREIVKHPVKKVLLVEIDAQVIEASKKYLPQVSDKAFEDKRVEVVIADAVEFLANSRERFDLIISDCTDAKGPSEVLWCKPFFEQVTNALNPAGLACFQTGFFKEKFSIKARARMAEVFPWLHIHHAYVQCFPFDESTFTLASPTPQPQNIGLAEVGKKFGALNIDTRYYSPEIHFASRVLPRGAGG